LLAHARQQFSHRKMGYDVALALPEEAALLLDEGRTAEVKELTRDLPAVFEAEEVPREALAALRLFHEAGAGSGVDYSKRSATTGSIRAARRAGTVLIHIATPMSTRGATSQVTGSSAFTPKS
jgi:hypothetical protein